MDLGIAGKVALVHGGGGGLGRPIAVSLAKERVQIAVADLDYGAASATALEVEAVGRRVMPQQWDLADLPSINRNVALIEDSVGTIDILVNISGSPPPSAGTGVSPEKWKIFFQSMVVSLIVVTDRVLPAMREKRCRRIITSTSSGVVAPIANLAISNALLSSLVGWSKSLSKEAAKDGITANIILPGRIASARIESLDEQRAEFSGKSREQISAESAAMIQSVDTGDPKKMEARLRSWQAPKRPLSKDQYFA